MTIYLRDLDTKIDAKDLLHPSALPFQAQRGLYTVVGKRFLDVILVILTVAVSVPLVAVFALLIALDGGRPFYSQLRVGYRGESFRMWKLRTMVPDADAKLEAHLAANPEARREWDATQKLKNDPRITPMGRILRKTSFDELPQLLNVFNGTMSLVGPRPMMVEQRLLYKNGYAYYRLRPGITGSWQISDRNDCDFVDRVQYDNDYERNVSLLTDVKILLATVRVVLRGTGY